MNEKELEQIYNEGYKSVYWTAMALLKNEADSEDVTQETFVTLIESYDKITDKSKVLPWLKKCVANKCLNRLTRTKTDAVEDEFFDEIESVPEDFLPEELAESEESRRILMDIINTSLSEDIKTTLILFYFDEMSTKEIAEALGVPQGTVLRRLNFARNKIKKEVEKYEKDNRTKLFGMALPFLTKLFIMEAEQVPMRPMPVSLTTALSASLKSTAAKAGAKAATDVAKTTGNVLIKRVAIIGASVLVVGAVTIGIIYFVNNNEISKETEETTTETTEETTTETTVIIEVDPFKYIDIAFNGTAPYGTASVSVSEECPVELNLVLSSSSDLNNGDVVTVAAECETEGYVLSSDTQEYTVSGLTRDVEVFTADTLQVENYMFEYPATVTIPGVNLSGLDTSELNLSIHDSLSDWEYNTTYQSYISDDYVCLFINGWGDYDLTQYTAFNIDVESGELLSKEDFLLACGLTKEEFDEIVYNTLSNSMDYSDDSKLVFDQANFACAEGQTCRDINLLPENIDTAIPYISERGNLCFVYNLNLPYGAEMYYYAFDTVTNECYYEGEWSYGH